MLSYILVPAASSIMERIWKGVWEEEGCGRRRRGGMWEEEEEGGNVGGGGGRECERRRECKGSRSVKEEEEGGRVWEERRV